MGEGGSKNVASTTDRNASSFLSVVGAKTGTGPTALASITIESRSSPLLSVDGAGSVGAVSGVVVGGIKSRAIVLVRKFMRDWVQPEGLGLLREK